MNRDEVMTYARDRWSPIILERSHLVILDDTLGTVGLEAALLYALTDVSEEVIAQAVEVMELDANLDEVESESGLPPGGPSGEPDGPFDEEFA